jgi:hypothetical protein
MEVSYFIGRALEEWMAAVKAAHPIARRRHVELAEAYEDRVRTMAAVERRSLIRLVDLS